MVSVNSSRAGLSLDLLFTTIMPDGDATLGLARMEHGKYIGVRGEPRRDGVCLLRKRSVLISVYFIESCDSLRPESRARMQCVRLVL